MQALLYTSVARAGLGGGDVFNIIQSSAKRNPERGVTGFLVYQGGKFLQLVEGEEAALDALLSDLASDPRHHSIEVIKRQAIEKRSFPDWRMKRVVGSKDDAALTNLLWTLRKIKFGEPFAAEVERFVGLTPAA